MTKRDGRNVKIIFALYILLELIYFAGSVIIGGKPGFPLDDTWIHLRYAENFYNGYIYHYNPGVPTPGTTSPLWVILLSAGFIFSSAPIIYSILLSSLFFAAVLYSTYRLSRHLGLNESYSFYITLLLVFSGRMLWASVSGMEITLFTFITLFVAYLHIGEINHQKLNFYTGLLLGIATTIRPEGGLFAIVYYVISVILLWNSKKGNVRPLVISIVLYCIIALPYPMFSYILTGSFTPNTFHGLYGGFRPLPDWIYLIESAKLFFKDNFVLLILWIITMMIFIKNIIYKKADKRTILINAWIILLPAVSSILIPNWRHYGRYLIPLIPFIHIAVFFMLNRYEDRFKAWKYYRYRTAFIYLTLFVSFAGTFLYSFLFSLNVENINNQQVKIAEWTRDNLRDERTIAVNDIGAITFITKKEVFDTEGLVTPEIFKRMQGKDNHERAKEMMKMIMEKNINYMIIYPHWYPEFMELFGSSLEHVHSERLRKNTICGGIEMFVFKIHRDKINL